MCRTDHWKAKIPGVLSRLTVTVNVIKFCYLIAETELDTFIEVMKFRSLLMFQECRRSISCCICWWSEVWTILLHSLTSSAYKKNRMKNFVTNWPGPILHVTHWNWLCKHILNQSFLAMPFCLNLDNNLLCGTLLNALWKSKSVCWQCEMAI